MTVHLWKSLIQKGAVVLFTIRKAGQQKIHVILLLMLGIEPDHSDHPDHYYHPNHPDHPNHYNHPYQRADMSAL